jgi:ADP-heptose:LPS heptosyltransferase
VADDETLIAVHPGITGAKNYWPLDRVVVVVKYLVSKPGVKVALFAGPEEAAALSMFKNLPVIAITGRSFPLFCALLARCRLAFSSDTMLGHAAAALKIPTITIYGRGNQNKHNRWGVPDYSINKLSKEDYPGPEKSFWAGDAGRAALEQVTVSEVTELFEQALFAIGKR